MRKNLLFALACFILFSFTASSQITKGSVLLGGGISGSSGTSEGDGGGGSESKTSGVSIYPAAGISVKDNVVVGLRLSYGKAKTKFNDSYTQRNQEVENYGAGIFYRRYIPLGQKFFIFGEGAVYYNRNKQEEKQVLVGSKQIASTVGANFYPGIAYAVSKKIHLEIGLNNLLDLSYNTGTTEHFSGSNTTRSESRGFNFAANVSTSAPLTVGFRFVLGK